MPWECLEVRIRSWFFLCTGRPCSHVSWCQSLWFWSKSLPLILSKLMEQVSCFESPCKSVFRIWVSWEKFKFFSMAFERSFVSILIRVMFLVYVGTIRLRKTQSNLWHSLFLKIWFVKIFSYLFHVFFVSIRIQSSQIFPHLHMHEILSLKHV